MCYGRLPPLSGKNTEFRNLGSMGTSSCKSMRTGGAWLSATAISTSSPWKLLNSAYNRTFVWWKHRKKMLFNSENKITGFLACRWVSRVALTLSIAALVYIQYKAMRIFYILMGPYILLLSPGYFWMVPLSLALVLRGWRVSTSQRKSNQAESSLSKLNWMFSGILWSGKRTFVW